MCLFNHSTLRSIYCYSRFLEEKSETWQGLGTRVPSQTNKFMFGSFRIQSGFASHWPCCLWLGRPGAGKRLPGGGGGAERGTLPAHTPSLLCLLIVLSLCQGKGHSHSGQSLAGTLPGALLVQRENRRAGSRVGPSNWFHCRRLRASGWCGQRQLTGFGWVRHERGEAASGSDGSVFTQTEALSHSTSLEGPPERLAHGCSPVAVISAEHMF